MSVEDWLRWPTKSTDPAANAAIAVLLALTAIVLVVVGGMILLPVVAVLGIAKAVHWYLHRPTPTGQLYAQAQERAVMANFPEPDRYLDAYLDRFLDAILEAPPAYSIYRTMAHIAKALYEQEHLNNPLPPIAASNAIEEGRYRDLLIAHQRKTADAPRTLEVFNAALTKSNLDMIAELPPMATTTREEFAKCGEIDPFATFPVLDVVPDAGRAVARTLFPFFREDVEELGLFSQLRKQFDRNFHEASASRHDLLMPDQHPGSPAEIVSAYLAGTPLEPLFYAPLPFSFTDRQRYEHMHIVGGSGHGKTQLLQRLILNDLHRHRSARADRHRQSGRDAAQDRALGDVRRHACRQTDRHRPGGRRTSARLEHVRY